MDTKLSKRRQLIDKWMDDRVQIKTQLLQEKLGKQEFQREVAVPLAKPVTESLKESQRAIDKKQDELIHKLSESQRAITNSISNLVVPAIEAPPPPLDPSTYVDIDKGLDVDVLRRQRFRLPSELLHMSRDELKTYRDGVSVRNRANAAKIKRGEMTVEESHMLSEYNERLKSMLSHHGTIQHSPPRTGQGIGARYEFGKLQLDADALANLRLIAYRDGKKVLSRKVDLDFIDLLTKRRNSRRTYSDASITTLTKLTDLAGITKTGGCVESVRYYKTPQELAKRLQLLIASKESGNVSAAVDNEMVSILNKLLADGAINKTQYKALHDECIS